jgi:hypothetical protein
VGLGDEAQLAGRAGAQVPFGDTPEILSQSRRAEARAGARSARCGSDDGLDQRESLARDLMRHGVASKAARTATVYSRGSTADIGVL